MSNMQRANIANIERLQAKKIAFISVFDKTGVDRLAKTLAEDYGYVILSTGGTKKFLEEKGIPAIESSEITGFDELLGGRVKSLYPAIFAGILAERDKANTPGYVMPEFLIDTVVVNLYPFEKERDEKAFANGKADPDHLLHFIDIGGSALIRAAAKNYPAVNILCDPVQYDAFLANLRENAPSGKPAPADKPLTSLAFRKQLAVQAFQRSVAYEAAIAAELAQQLAVQDSTGETSESAPLPEAVTLPLLKIQDLRYGENPHQDAALYGVGAKDVPFECLAGKELSFNNILDMESAWALVSEFDANSPEGRFGCAIIKHNNPCGVAVSGQSLADAYQRAFDVDPLSAFGGVVALNSSVDADTATQMKDVFLEVIVAPDFSPEAVDILTVKKNLRLVRHRRAMGVSEPLTVQAKQTSRAASPSLRTYDYKQVSPGLFLVQSSNPARETKIEALVEQAQVQVVTDAKPTPEQLRDMVFAWKVVKHVKSNAIVLANKGRTVGIGVGQTSRIGALENALKLACDEAKDAVLASDGFLPHEDNVHAAAQARVAAIIQPGGSIKDKDVIALANQNQIAMILTGIREFKH